MFSPPPRKCHQMHHPEVSGIGNVCRQGYSICPGSHTSGPSEEASRRRPLPASAPPAHFSGHSTPPWQSGIRPNGAGAGAGSGRARRRTVSPGRPTPLPLRTHGAARPCTSQVCNAGTAVRGRGGRRAAEPTPLPVRTHGAVRPCAPPVMGHWYGRARPEERPPRPDQHLCH